MTAPSDHLDLVAVLRDHITSTVSTDVLPYFPPDGFPTSEEVWREFFGAAEDAARDRLRGLSAGWTQTLALIVAQDEINAQRAADILEMAYKHYPQRFVLGCGGAPRFARADGAPPRRRLARRLSRRRPRRRNTADGRRRRAHGRPR